jgi:hypothetical protein
MVMARRGDSEGGTYGQAYKLRRGRQLWIGDDWADVTAVRITGESVLITMADGRVFRAGYMDAILSRKTPPATLGPPHSVPPQRFRCTRLPCSSLAPTTC